MKKRYSIDRSNKYAYSKYKNMSFSAYKEIIIGGVVVLIAAALIIYNVLNEDLPEISTVESIPISYEDTKPDIIEDTYEQALIREYCAVYQIDYDIVYDKLCELTDNFTSAEYLSGTISGITFKGEQAVFENQDALLLAAVRCCDQTPGELNLTNIETNKAYETDLTFAQQIKKYADIFEVDECLMYAIIKSETNFGSNLSRQTHNLANLKGSDGWMVFDNETQSIIELATEIRKFNNLGKYTIEEIRESYAPESDDNEHWIPNVTQIRDDAIVNYEEIFGVPNKGMNFN